MNKQPFSTINAYLQLQSVSSFSNPEHFWSFGFLLVLLLLLVDVVLTVELLLEDEEVFDVVVVVVVLLLLRSLLSLL